MTPRALLIGLLFSLLFWLLLGSCGYYGYKWAIRDRKVNVHRNLGAEK